MGVEKQGSKWGGGGYVGGFLQLFDWNVKSRKKLFSNKSDFPEGSKQGKRSDENLLITCLHVMDEDGNGGGSSIKGSSDHSYASSVTDDEGCGVRAPGVVARLMGLDSLPTYNVAEPYSTPNFDFRSLRDAHYHRRNTEFHREHNQIMHSDSLSNKVEGFYRNPIESRPQRMQNRPIERFQTEMLPPKSAKSIPITHHKLLSPIKSPGFIPSKNAAHIMEAAARIIERGPQASSKAKMPFIGHSSVPLKVHDLKEKIEASRSSSKLPEASRRPVETNAIRGKSLSKNCNVPEDITRFRASPDSEESASVGSKNKGKSISLAIQAKVNVQRRKGLQSVGSRTLQSQKEYNEINSRPPINNQSNTKKGTQKKSSIQSASGILRQNNQKQNCLMDKDKLPSKPSDSKQPGKNALSGDPSFGRSKTLHKGAGNSNVGSRKMGLDANDIERGVLSTRTKNFPQKKRSISEDFQFEKNRVFDTVLLDKSEKPIQSSVATDEHLKRVEDNRRKGMDVVSFTFSSPMIKPMHGSQSNCQIVEKSHSCCIDSWGGKFFPDTKNSRLSSLGLNLIRGDALSILLEQKLRELTYGVESSSLHNSVKAESVASSASNSIVEDLASDFSAVSIRSLEHNRSSQLGSHTNKSVSLYDSNLSSAQCQGVDDMGESSVSNSEISKELDCRHPSPVSVLEPSFSNESCNSSDSGNTNGSKQCPTAQAQEMVGFNCLKRFQSVEAEAELSDSASSTVNTASTRPTKWELEYVRNIVSNMELTFEDFALDRACETLNPHLFDHLENQNSSLECGEEKDSSIRRRLLLDCVCECLDLRCKGYVGGGSRGWAKGTAMLRRKRWLAGEVYKEISGWKGMGDWMVDELVDKDMSSQYGRWLDFEIETFEVGVEIERGILNSLVSEVVADILFL